MNNYVTERDLAPHLRNRDEEVIHTHDRLYYRKPEVDDLVRRRRDRNFVWQWSFDCGSDFSSTYIKGSLPIVGRTDNFPALPSKWSSLKKWMKQSVKLRFGQGASTPAYQGATSFMFVPRKSGIYEINIDIEVIATSSADTTLSFYILKRSTGNTKTWTNIKVGEWFIANGTEQTIRINSTHTLELLAKIDESTMAVGDSFSTNKWTTNTPPRQYGSKNEKLYLAFVGANVQIKQGSSNVPQIITIERIIQERFQPYSVAPSLKRYKIELATRSYWASEFTNITKSRAILCTIGRALNLPTSYDEDLENVITVFTALPNGEYITLDHSCQWSKVFGYIQQLPRMEDGTRFDDMVMRVTRII